MQRILTAATVIFLTACSDGGSSVANAPDETPSPPPAAPAATFEIRATNLTIGQPMSPLAVLIHDADEAVFRIGEPASEGLELLAEAGDNSQLLSDMESVVQASGNAPIGPGGSETLSLELTDDQTDGLFLSLVSMLVNTNDAITGRSGLALEDIAVGASVSFSGVTYDAGTEANSEEAGTIPGPADEGEGFNADRNDIGDFVTMHPGVVTADDGLRASVLDQTHRFDNPVLRVTVTRTQ